MSQSKIFIDIGNSAIKWRTTESNVYSKSVDKFLLNTLPQADTAWVSAVANLNIAEDLETHFDEVHLVHTCLLYTSPSPRDLSTSRMPSSA